MAVESRESGGVADIQEDTTTPAPFLQEAATAAEAVTDIAIEAASTAQAAATAANAADVKAAFRAKRTAQTATDVAAQAATDVASEAAATAKAMTVAATMAASKAADVASRRPAGASTETATDLAAEAAATAEAMVVAAAAAAAATIVQARRTAQAVTDASAQTASDLAAEAAVTAEAMITTAAAAAASTMVVAAAAAEAADRLQGAEEARNEAERANRAKTDFLSRMSHELRTPLGALLGFTSIMNEDRKEFAPRHQEMIERMDRAGHHLLSLVNDVLDISRIESGGLSLSVAPVSLHDAVKRALELTDQLVLAQFLTVTTEVDSSLWVIADESRLQQVMVNLLSNAAKFNQRDGVIAVRAEVQATSVRLSIFNSGSAIATEQVINLFTPFARLGAESSSVEGTGLGLTLSKALVERMDGVLELVSSGAAGTTFAVVLPRTPPPARRSDQVAGELQFDQFSARVVYIEDNEVNVAVFAAMFARCPNVSVAVAVDGHSGIDLVRSLMPDVVFLDLGLPDIDGREVIAALRSNIETSKIPVIVLTADAIGSGVVDMKALGASAYLTKPASQRELLNALAENT